MTPILHNIFQKLILSFLVNSMRPKFLKLKPDKDTTRKKKLKPVSLMDVDSKILDKIIEN